MTPFNQHALPQPPSLLYARMPESRGSRLPAFSGTSASSLPITTASKATAGMNIKTLKANISPSYLRLYFTCENQSPQSLTTTLQDSDIMSQETFQNRTELQ